MTLIEPKLEDLPLLIELLGDPDPRYRQEAAYSLGRLGPKGHKAVPALIRRVEQDEEFGVRQIAMAALALIGREAKAAIPCLIQILKTGDKAFRLEAIQAIARIGPASKEATAAITEALLDADEDVRQAAAVVMHRMVG